MPYSVLIVDDSNFFQTRLKEIVDECPDLKTVGVAANGQEAIDLAAKLKPDIISMDYEMPMLDGVTAVRIIMQENPTPIVMFSSMTYEGARITLDALEAGAVDFMNKNFSEVSNNSVNFKKRYHEKLVMFAKSANTKAAAPSAHVSAPPMSSLSRQPEAREPASPRREFRSSTPSATTSSSASTETRSSSRSSSVKVPNNPKLLAIGASTGGPVALADIITSLPANFPLPILIIQHMPENFTKAFAERLDRQSALSVKEAESGDRIERGKVLVAPGGKQMMIDRSGKAVKIIDGDDRVNYKPCVDITFASAATIFGSSVIGLILTGMGSDGCDGARLLVERGSVIWSQDQKSCVVYGMPAAVAKENLSSCVLPLKEIADKLIGALC